MEHSYLCVGIDLGTTNSVISTCKVQGTRITTPVSNVERVSNITSNGREKERDKKRLPSYVYYMDAKDGSYEPIVGDYAKKIWATQPYAVARSIKKQMGKASVNIPGWREEYQDQTPEAVSAQILRQMLSQLEKQYGEKITDAVITVPASFDAAQSIATLKAAEKAGLQVKEEDGTYRYDMLISEPEAVIYHVINEVQNGYVNMPVDFDSPKNVLVFDIGGGTLDVTLHRIERAGEGVNNYNLEQLATNRFSTVAGDTFDETLAEVMYKKYIDEYGCRGEQYVKQIKDDKSSKIKLVYYAEDLKLRVNRQYTDRMENGRPLSSEYEFEYGGQMNNGLSSDAEMTLEEFESALEPLMGRKYKYDDYKKFDSITDEGNIIFPVLDVLNKAKNKLKTEDVKVDAVILNGGMSQLYLIKDRLKEFFGIEPITITDPDYSVAQGASVYHYYMHKGEKSLMLHNKFAEEAENQNETIIQSVSNVLNETVYLGLRGGTAVPLAAAGAELPYRSEVRLDFSIPAGENRLRVPIKQKASNRKNDYRTLASGDITFKSVHDTELPVAICFTLHKNNILSFEAWTYTDAHGKKVGERAYVDLSFNTKDLDKYIRRKKNTLLNPPPGTELDVKNELSAFKEEVSRHNGIKDSKRRSASVKNIKKMAQRIAECGNPADFAKESVAMLNKCNEKIMNMNYLPVARLHSRYWGEPDKKELSKYSVDVLAKELLGLPTDPHEKRAANEAIKTIGVCGIKADMEKIMRFKNNSDYKNSVLYAMGASGYGGEWIFDEFLKEANERTPEKGLIRALAPATWEGRTSVPRAVAEQTFIAIKNLIEDASLEYKDMAFMLISLANIYDNYLKDDAGCRDEAIRAVAGVADRYEGRPSKDFIVENAIDAATSIIGEEEPDDSQVNFIIRLLNG